jgi:hypothetical protein
MSKRPIRESNDSIRELILAELEAVSGAVLPHTNWPEGTQPSPTNPN